MEKGKYSNYYIYDYPIPYIPSKLVEYYKLIEKEIINIKNIKNLSGEQEQSLITLEEQLKNLQNQSFLIYPPLVTDFIIFYTCIDCLIINKNIIPDIKIIKMSYLDFLFYKSEQETDKVTLQKLCTILNLCLKLSNEDIRYVKDKDNKYKLYLKNIEYNGEDFEEIRQIICLQSDIELPNENMHPDLKKALDEAQEYYNSIKGNGKTGTLEDQLDCIVAANTGYKYEDLYKLTIRRFKRLLARVDYKLHYQIYKTAEMGGMVKFKKPIENWTNDLTQTLEEKYANVMVDAEGLKAKVNMTDIQKQ